MSAPFLRISVAALLLPFLASCGLGPTRAQREAHARLSPELQALMAPGGGDPATRAVAANHLIRVGEERAVQELLDAAASRDDRKVPGADEPCVVASMLYPRDRPHPLELIPSSNPNYRGPSRRAGGAARWPFGSDAG